MGNTFGLGLVLSFTDNASVALGRVTNTISTLEATARGASGVLNSLGASMDALSSIGSTMSGLITAPVTGFLKQITEWGVQRASSVQQLQIAFETFMGSAQGASQYLDKVMEYAKTTPYAFDDLAQIAQSLIAYGVDANVVLGQTGDQFTGIMQALGDWSGATAKGVSGMYDVAGVLARIKSLGQVDGQLLMSLQGRGLQVSKMIGNLHNLTEAEAEAYIKTMSADDFISDLVKGIEEGTDGVNGATAAMGGMVVKIKDTWVGAQDSFKSALKNAGLSLMGKYIDENGISHYKFLESMTTSLNNISSAIKNISTVLQPLMDIIEKVMLTVSEAVKNIAQYYADLDDETKKHIGNVIAILTLLGPALIVFSSFGRMLVRLVGFIQTFTTGMGTMSLILTTILFGIGTNFDGTRKKAEAFFKDVTEGITTAIKAVNEGADAVSKVLTDLGHSKFYNNFTKRLMQIMGVIKAVASAWEDGFVNVELWDLMNALGIRPVVEAILNLKYNIQNFFEGFKIGFDNVINEAESFIGKLVSIFKNSPLAPIFQLIQDMLHSWIEAGQGDHFKNLGERFANMLPMILAVVTGMRAFGGIGGIFTTITSTVGGLINTLARLGGNILAPIAGSVSGFGSSFLESILPNFRSGAAESARETIMSEFRDLFGDIDVGDKEGALSNFIERTKGLGIAEDIVKQKGEECYDTFIEGLLQAESEAGGLTRTDFLNNLIAHPLQGMRGLFSSFGQGILGFVKNLGAFLATPLGILTAIVALIGVMYATNENFRESINMLLGAVMEVIGVIISALAPVFDVIKQIFAVVMQVIQVLAEVLAPIVKLIAGIIHALAPVIKVILDICMIPIKIIASILKVIADVIGLIVQAIVAVKDAIMEKIKPLIDWLQPIIDAVGGFFDKLHNWLSGNGWKSSKKVALDEQTQGKTVVNSETTIGFGELLNLGSQNESVFASPTESEPVNTQQSASGYQTNLVPQEYSPAQQVQEIETTNTITFNKESIVIQIAQATVDEAEALANRVIDIVKSRMETNSMASYNSDLQNQSRNMSYMMAR